MAITDHLKTNNLTEVSEEAVVLALYRAVTDGKSFSVAFARKLGCIYGRPIKAFLLLLLQPPSDRSLCLR